MNLPPAQGAYVARAESAITGEQERPLHMLACRAVGGNEAFQLVNLQIVALALDMIHTVVGRYAVKRVLLDIVVSDSPVESRAQRGCKGSDAVDCKRSLRARFIIVTQEMGKRYAVVLVGLFQGHTVSPELCQSLFQSAESRRAHRLTVILNPFLVEVYEVKEPHA